jgi:sodium transport system permease protein
LAVALFNRVGLRSGFSWVAPSVLGVIAAAMLGVALWPAAHELILFGRWLGIPTLRADQLAGAEQLLEAWKSVPLWVILTSLAVAPGVFEELFFRGFLYPSLRTIFTPWRAIVASAVLFGLFHVVAATALAPERFLPSFFLGLALGWVRYRTGSVVPCMVLHVLHNGLMLAIVHWREELMARGIGVEEVEHLPISWLAGAALVAVAALALLQLSSRPSNPATAAAMV